jgi:transposase
MTRFVVGDDRSQSTLFPERLEDYLAEDNPVRAIDVFVDELDLSIPDKLKYQSPHSCYRLSKAWMHR